MWSWFCLNTNPLYRLPLLAGGIKFGTAVSVVLIVGKQLQVPSKFGKQSDAQNKISCKSQDIVQSRVKSWFKVSEVSGTAPIICLWCRITGQQPINASLAKMPCFSPLFQLINVVVCFTLPIICNQENRSYWVPKCSVGNILLESWAKWDIPQKG